MSRSGDMQSQDRTAEGRAQTSGAKAEGRATQIPPKGRGPLCQRSSAGDREVGLRAFLVFLRPRPRRAPLLGLSETLLGVLELLFERGRVELLGRDRLLDEEPGPVAVDLEPAVRLRVPARLRVAG